MSHSKAGRITIRTLCLATAVMAVNWGIFRAAIKEGRVGLVFLIVGLLPCLIAVSIKLMRWLDGRPRTPFGMGFAAGVAAGSAAFLAFAFREPDRLDGYLFETTVSVRSWLTVLQPLVGSNVAAATSVTMASFILTLVAVSSGPAVLCGLLLGGCADMIRRGWKRKELEQLV